MIVLFFEVHPRLGQREYYFERAAALRSELEKNPGLLFIDRYQSLARNEIILSHSHWRDEPSVAAWRNHQGHHATQVQGRNVHFQDYRIRIAQVIMDSGTNGIVRAYDEENTNDSFALKSPRYVVSIHSSDRPYLAEGEAFASVNRQGEFVTLFSSNDEPQARQVLQTALEGESVYDAKLSVVARDYGMFDRDEAPQYFPQIARTN